jgi:uncharacterized protein YbaR (Trm112 family)
MLFLNQGRSFMRRFNCIQAAEILSAYLEDPNWHRAEATAAISHVAACPDCRHNMDSLLQALAAEGEDQMNCDECETLLPEYLLAEEDGKSQQDRWRPLALHLLVCPHCSSEHTALSAMARMELEERGAEPARYPVPDLSFLSDARKKTAQSQADFWHLDELGRLIIRLATALLPPPARLAPVYAVREEEEISAPEAGGRRSLGRLSLGSPTLDDLEVDVTVLPSKDDPALCVIVARVEMPSRWPNVAGSEVTLEAGGIVSTVVTDESGEATFRGVALAALDSATLSVRVEGRGTD